MKAFDYLKGKSGIYLIEYYSFKDRKKVIKLGRAECLSRRLNLYFSPSYSISNFPHVNNYFITSIHYKLTTDAKTEEKHYKDYMNKNYKLCGGKEFFYVNGDLTTSFSFEGFTQHIIK